MADATGSQGLNILIIGHGCLPQWGSEPGITWNWAWHLASTNRVWVITHGYFREAIESYLRDNPRPSLKFIWVGPLGRFDPWKGKTPRGIRLHYLLWQRGALRAAKRLVVSHKIDVIHYVSWNTVSAPPLVWKLGRPFVWGPVGGGQTVPWRFLKYFGTGAALEILRTLRVRMMPWTPALRSAVAHADLLIAANGETAAILEAAGANSTLCLPDTGVPSGAIPSATVPCREKGPFTVLWAGRIEHRKALPLCLEVAKAVRTPDVRFFIAGDGPQQRQSQRYAERLGVENRVTFLGRLAWVELQQRFAEAHILLLTSVRDTFPSVIWEAMAKGCPIVCLDHNGQGTHVPASAAVKLAVTTPSMVVAQMAGAIEQLASDRSRLKDMSEAAYHFAVQQRWENRAAIMENWYRDLLGYGSERQVGKSRSQTDSPPLV